MPSNATYACIPCRFSAKQTTTCPYCHQAMTFMGNAFKPPRKSNDSQWRKVAILVEHDVRFGYCQCHRPRWNKFLTLSDAKNLVDNRRSGKKKRVKVPSVKERQIRDRITWFGRNY